MLIAPSTSRTLALAAATIAVLVPASSAAQKIAPSLTATPATIEFGKGDIMLSGVVPSKRAGEPLSILSQACLFTEPAEIATVTTRAGGAFRFRVQPMLNTTFSVRWNDSVSAAVRVGVRPVVALRRIANGRYRVEVSTTNPVFLNGKTVELQHAVGKRWVTVKRAPLAKASPETAIRVLSAVTISARVTGTVRAKLPQAQAGCYLGATSGSIGA